MLIRCRGWTVKMKLGREEEEEEEGKRGAVEKAGTIYQAEKKGHYANKRARFPGQERAQA
jgi:hypothetical protein